MVSKKLLKVRKKIEQTQGEREKEGRKGRTAFKRTESTLENIDTR